MVVTLLQRSLGGIGKLYYDDLLIGEVYYNIRQGKLPAQLLCSVVFVGKDVELPSDSRLYFLFIEDGRYLIVTLHRDRALAPYICSSQDGMLHSEFTLLGHKTLT